MSRDTVLIAAFSARALASSARRAGFEPLVVDCFGDLDTIVNAPHSICLPARVQTGFTFRPLVAALDQLAAAATRPPIGLVLGSGFECNPRLVAKLAERYRLIGNSPEVIRRSKDPTQFFSVLDELGIRHPETQLPAPASPEGWLMKRIGGSGGLHIHDCPAEPLPDARRYFQRKIAGESISLLGAISQASSAFAISRQWTSPRPKRPYRYGGAAGSLLLEEDLEARLISEALEVGEALGLCGLVSFDYLVENGEAQLIEVNPRPGATLDIFDDAAGTLFKVHVEAALGGDPAGYLSAHWHPPIARAAAFLYADRGPLIVPAVTWPDWVSDRPKPGSAIARGEPVATVIAEGDDLDAVQETCLAHVRVLEGILYEGGHGLE
ncbi:MAG: ATP-grasp domain-containing protein [Hyphomicrobium sp.]